MADENAPASRRWYRALGPGLITACVVIGPGSILTSSKVGAEHGYSMSWIVLASAIFMLTFIQMAARLGVVANESPGQLLAARAGRWLAVLIGVSIFFVASAFQFGNNLGVHSAFEAYFQFEYIIVVFNLAAIAFLFFFKNLYRALEKLMMGFVGLMLLAFAANLLFAKPNPTEWREAWCPTASARWTFLCSVWWELLSRLPQRIFKSISYDKRGLSEKTCRRASLIPAWAFC
jgi:NRAMP (natural resistance-associated macrophage protein)-like metal ion transporter